MRGRILLIEDEPGLILTLGDRLISEGYVVDTARDSQSGLKKAADGHFDLIILDVMLPGGSGFDVCRELRQQGLTLPIVMLTARGQLIDKLLGLKIGADDYITKPFEMAELIARVEAQLRRTLIRPLAMLPLSYQFGSIRVNSQRAEVERDGKVVELSALEFKLLKFLIIRRGDTLSRDQMLNEVWGYDAMPSTRTVDVHIAGLRQKLEDNPRQPQYILTAHGLGYKFVG
ncbi:MAG: response regulator transcription factor [Verrucomicrobia bacterium]|nr:response regulator transcription factor [Verrucomicrobiota bacterium]